MNIPEDLQYTKEHEWIRVEGSRATVGITDYAQDTLGDIVYIELPEVGSEVSAQEEVTTIESVKGLRGRISSARATAVSGISAQIPGPSPVRVRATSNAVAAAAPTGTAS